MFRQGAFHSPVNAYTTGPPSKTVPASRYAAMCQVLAPLCWNSPPARRITIGWTKRGSRLTSYNAYVTPSSGLHLSPPVRRITIVGPKWASLPSGAHFPATSASCRPAPAADGKPHPLVLGPPASCSPAGHFAETILLLVPVRVPYPPVRRLKVVNTSHNNSAHSVSAHERHPGHGPTAARAYHPADPPFSLGAPLLQQHQPWVAQTSKHHEKRSFQASKPTAVMGEAFRTLSCGFCIYAQKNEFTL